MIKNINKSQKELPDIPEEQKYKKKRISSGQPRAKHKHKYETVLLKTCYDYTDHLTGKSSCRISRYPTKVCIICGSLYFFKMNTFLVCFCSTIFTFMKSKSFTIFKMHNSFHLIFTFRTFHIITPLQNIVLHVLIHRLLLDKKYLVFQIY